MRTHEIIQGLELYDYPRTALIFTLSPTLPVSPFTGENRAVFRARLNSLVERAFPGKFAKNTESTMSTAIWDAACRAGPHPGWYKIKERDPFYVTINQATFRDIFLYKGIGSKGLEYVDDLITAIRLYANDIEPLF